MVVGDRIHLYELSVAPEHGRKELGTRLIDRDNNSICQKFWIHWCYLIDLSGHSLECTILQKARISSHDRGGNWH